MSLLNYIQLPLINMGILKLNDDPTVKDSYLYYEPLDETKFLRVCQERKTFPILYKAEFQLASKYTHPPSEAATRDENIGKNRNQLILPYEENRVLLDGSEESPSDYINASYVNSLMRPRKYIVTQGPLESTVGDFWKMIWKEKVSTIIMLTKCFDFTKKMCFPYWPSHEHGQEEFGGVHIQLESKEVLANFTTQRLTVWRDESNETRQLVHFHYTDWPCFRPPFSPSILDFRRRIKQVVSGKAELANGKTLVHCNDGSLRSGTYLAIDANLESFERDGVLNVFGYLKTLKKCRPGLVETENQVKFIYETLEEYLTNHETWFPISELPLQMELKSGKESKVKDGGYRREYQLISSFTPSFSIGDCAGSYRDENRMKNRDISIIAPDDFRPYLMSPQDTDFINAVFVDRYREGKGIITEWPMQDTISLFWSLVYDYDVSGVVILDDLHFVDYPPFWPQESQIETYGVFTVRHLSHSHLPNIRTWVFEINKKIVSLSDLMTGIKAETKTVKFLQLTNWSMEEKLPSSTVPLVDIMILAERCREESGGPLLLVSHDGRKKVGVLQTAMNTIEQVLNHKEVDVFTTVRQLRRYRPVIIPNLTQCMPDIQLIQFIVYVCILATELRPLLLGQQLSPISVFSFIETICCPKGFNYIKIVKNYEEGFWLC